MTARIDEAGVEHFEPYQANSQRVSSVSTEDAIANLNAMAFAVHKGAKRRLIAWKNPTNDVVRVDFPSGETRPADAFLRVVWQPGETHLIDSVHAGGIQRRIRMPGDGGHIIVAGSAPQLQRVDQPARVHPALTGSPEAPANASPRRRAQED